MTRIKICLAAFLGLLSALWLLADSLWPQPFTYFSFRTVFMQYSGVVAVGMMSVAMLLALRPKWLEPTLDGLDKMYRLHKWLGISGLVLAILHWLFSQAPKWLVGAGWLERRLYRDSIAQGAVYHVAALAPVVAATFPNTPKAKPTG